MNLRGQRFLTLLLGLILVVGLGACSSKPTLNEADQKIFDKACDMVRSDDKNQYPEAEKLFKDIITRNPDFKDAIFWHAQMLVAWGDALAQETKVLSEQTKKLKAMVDEVQQKYRQTRRVRDKKKVKENMEKLTAAFKQVNKLYNKWLEDTTAIKDRAFEMVAKNVAGDPAPSYMAHRVLADYYRVQAHKPKCLEFMDNVKQMNPDSVGLRFIQGALTMTLDEKPAEAIPLFDEALKKDPKFTKALYYKGLALDKMGKKAEAEAVMKDVIKQSANHLGAKTYLDMTTVVLEAGKALEGFNAELLPPDSTEGEAINEDADKKKK